MKFFDKLANWQRIQIWKKGGWGGGLGLGLVNFFKNSHP